MRNLVRIRDSWNIRLDLGFTEIFNYTSWPTFEKWVKKVRQNSWNRRLGPGSTKLLKYRAWARFNQMVEVYDMAQVWQSGWSTPVFDLGQVRPNGLTYTTWLRYHKWLTYTTWPRLDKLFETYGLAQARNSGWHIRHGPSSTKWLNYAWLCVNANPNSNSQPWESKAAASIKPPKTALVDKIPRRRSRETDTLGPWSVWRRSALSFVPTKGIHGPVLVIFSLDFFIWCIWYSTCCVE